MLQFYRCWLQKSSAALPFVGDASVEMLCDSEAESKRTLSHSHWLYVSRCSLRLLFVCLLKILNERCGYIHTQTHTFIAHGNRQVCAFLIQINK